MIKILKAPLQLEPFLDEFGDLFTKPSYRSFRDLCAALSVCDKSKTVANLYDTMADCRKEKKARSSYNWFFSDANWDENEVAQRKVNLFIEHLSLKNDDKILLIIDDTYNEKEGTQTDGVGKFYDHSKEAYIWGNNFVTSVVQSKGLFIPHKAKMYVKDEHENENFKTKLELAYEDIIEPLKVPKDIPLYIVFDSWWFSADLFNKCLNLGHNIVCQIKSDKKVGINNIMSYHVKDMANQIEDKYFIKTAVNVRGKKKTYYTFEKDVILDKIGVVKLVISKRKKDGTTKYIISTNKFLSSKEIISIYEDRWDIETAHRETNQKLGFKDYQLREKHSIERFIQLVFSVWTAILLWELDNPLPKDGSKSRTMGDMIDRVKMQAAGETFEYVMTYFNLPVPDGGLLYILKSLGLKI
ncbi:MAG: IS701 family transposase [Methanothrix sp.]|nr:IS701 family transposase [Methanothrix sp.]